MNERYARAKDLAVEHVETFALELWRAEPRHKSKSVWNIADPYRPDAKPGNLALALTRRRGAFQDFESGLKGDALDFVAHGLCGRIDRDSRRDAVAFIEQRFGLGTMDPAQRAKLAAESEAKRKAAEAKAARDLAARRERARKRFWAMQPVRTQAGWCGTLFETYMAARGIDVRAMPHLAGSFRFDPDCEWWVDQETPKRRFPAIVSAMVDGGGTVCANHFTFLAADGTGKAALGRQAKMMFPDTHGLVIRVTNGPGGLQPEAAAQAGQRDIVFVGEGIEDAATAGFVDPELRCWAAGSLAGLLHMPDHAVAAGYMIGRDNDWGKPAAEASFERAIARIRSWGKPVEVVSSKHGKDFNDELTGKE